MVHKNFHKLKKNENQILFYFIQIKFMYYKLKFEILEKGYFI